jgi:two-component system, OmpR family, response regulator MprA
VPAGAGAGGHHGGVPNRVLVVDDDRAIRESLVRALELEGYDVVAVVDGVEALTRARRDAFAVETPDRVAGLDAGADDYLPKPFELDELFARLRALLRRAAPAPGDGTRAGAVLQIASLRVDPAARRAWWTDEELQLSKTEFDLLELMVRNEGIVLDHTTVYQRIWGYDFGADSKNLAVYVGYLRRKLACAGAPNLIHTVRGVGYAVRKP